MIEAVQELSRRLRVGIFDTTCSTRGPVSLVISSFIDRYSGAVPPGREPVEPSFNISRGQEKAAAISSGNFWKSPLSEQF